MIIIETVVSALEDASFTEQMPELVESDYVLLSEEEVEKES